jgi:hypothetical protein
VSQGKYEYEYNYVAQETNDYTASSNYQDSGSSEIPRTISTQDAEYGDSSQAAFSTSPVTPAYTTSAYDNATAAFENLDLNKGKERETGKFTCCVMTFNMSQLTFCKNMWARVRLHIRLHLRFLRACPLHRPWIIAIGTWEVVILVMARSISRTQIHRHTSNLPIL